ncbi:MAG: hypothetical protein ACI83P_001428, partial [Janthinobacterium sp.]
MQHAAFRLSGASNTVRATTLQWQLAIPSDQDNHSLFHARQRCS